MAAVTEIRIPLFLRLGAGDEAEIGAVYVPVRFETGDTTRAVADAAAGSYALTETSRSLLATGRTDRAQAEIREFLNELHNRRAD